MTRSAAENARLTDSQHTIPVLRRGLGRIPAGHRAEMTVTAVTIWDDETRPVDMLAGIFGFAVGTDGDGNEFTVPVMNLTPAEGDRLLLLFRQGGDAVIVDITRDLSL